ncbi:MAG: hypothetical protein CVT67_04225 [Actinobacteria bacterium HGW-Actinobacteria-7]|jgi:uncharacterized protein with PQ loop repeat|nr:MAG: hypothetical protein CVT67_04225 [Actinobacteria bacterium HGW-Actinobacteria-7]
MLQLNDLKDSLTARGWPLPSFPTAFGSLGRRVADTHARVGAERVDIAKVRSGMERAVFSFGLVNPVLSLPQMYNIFVLKHVAGLSVITVGSAFFMSLLWTAYGALGKQTAVWATNAVWVFFNGAMLVGVVVFST